MYRGGPALLRSLQHWRPYICPFEELARHVPAGARILDAGCGAGLFLALLAHEGRLARGVGFDVSAEAIELASNMARSTGHDDRLEFLRLSVGEAWPEGPFDAVSLIDVLHHVPPAGQRECFLTAAARLGPGGVLIYKDMARRPVWRALANRLHDLVLARQWIHYVPVERVEGWAAEAGLGLTRAARFNRLWYAHELRVFRSPA